MSFTAIVPVRAGSKGLPGKNVRLLAGVALWQRAVDQARDAGAARIVVSTDVPEILGAPNKAGIDTLERPEELAGDTVPMAPVLTHAIEACAIEGTVVLLQCTSPLRSVEDIVAGLERFAEGGVDLVMSVTEADRSVLKLGTIQNGRFSAFVDPAHPFMNRQALPEVYKPNGAVYVFDAAWFIKNGGFTTDRIGTLIMPAERSDDIDTEEDFTRIERALSHQ